MSAPLPTGTRVTTPRGPGTVAYPVFGDDGAILRYGVRLDAKAHRPTYIGTVFTARDVTEIR